MSLPALAAVALTAGLEAVAAEPPRRLHPVAWFGRAVGPFDRGFGRPLAAGTVAAVALPLAAAGAVGGAVVVAGRAAGALVPGAGPWGRAAAAGLALFTATSLRMLLAEAAAVVELSAADPAAARERLPALAGRDPASLSPAELRSAAVESAAENLADGLVAPLAPFAVLAPVSLPLAAAAAAWVKAVNTLDSVLGYRSKAVGTPAARLDDAVMFAPARASAALLALAAGAPAALAGARRLARRPSSPNAGWPMGAAAAALSVRLCKPGAYDLRPAGERADGGAGRADPAAGLPTPADGRAAVALVRRAGALAYALALGPAALAVVMAWP